VAIRGVLVLLLACSTSAGVTAQPIDPSIDQISSGPRGVELRSATPDVERSGVPPTQLATGAESSPATVQVSPERRGVSPPDQLSKAGKTAQQPQPLSVPAQGRQSAVDRVEGADRCDPAEPMRPRRRCANVIENRSSEFARPDSNALSPEQRLLLEQEVREGALSTDGGARRLATTGETDGSMVAMGVAAVVLRPNEEAPPKTRPDEDVTKAADIVGAIINQPLTPPPPQ
jgi:hypothetical protein